MSSSGPPDPRGITEDLVAAFVRLARGDFAVRLPRNFKRDSDDTLAFLVNLLAEELDRMQQERERSLRELEKNVADLSEMFLALAAGNFGVRAPRTGRGDPGDVLAFMFNNTAAEVGEAVGELDRQRKVLEAILESMIDGVLLLDENGMIVRANAAMARLLGAHAGSLFGTPLALVLDTSERDMLPALASSLLQAPFIARDTKFVTATGQTVTLTVNASAQKDAAGELAGIVLVARDDRELKRAQARLQMSDRLASMGTIAAGVAHEINNPLAFVIGNLDFVGEELELLAEREGTDRETLEELLKAVRASKGGADRVRQIVRDLKTFSRADPEATELVDLHKLIDTSTNLVHNEVRHHARVVKEYGVVPAVRANEGRLVQVFLNLLQNAAQAIPPGRVEDNAVRIVTGTEPDGSVFVEIHDTGSGISAEALPRIFDAFFTTKAPGFGTGLGLSICREIVTSLGGTIGVESEPGKGTVFRIVLPAPAAGDDRASAPPREQTATRPSRGLRILVVDDELEIGQSVFRMLSKDHEVHVVTSGVAALELAGRRDYDVVLSDLLMPEMTGMELHARLSEVRPELATRMVFMSGGTFSPAARQFLESVPNRRIEKPFDAQALRELMASLAG